MGFFTMRDLKSRTLAQGVEMKTLSGERVMMAFFRLEPGGVVPEHSHPHEQMGLVLEGEFELVISGEKRVVRKGDVYHVPPEVRHSGTASRSPAQVLDVFVPPREDYK